ncbi:MAG: hypothetical protein RLY31_667 [Bacteroidota bacterium]
MLWVEVSFTPCQYKMFPMRMAAHREHPAFLPGEPMVVRCSLSEGDFSFSGACGQRDTEACLSASGSGASFAEAYGLDDPVAVIHQAYEIDAVRQIGDVELAAVRIVESLDPFA